MREPLAISTLGFGCAPVMGRVGKARALRAMAEAFSLSVTHFDIARSYGFGDAEGVLGTFLKGRRDRVTVTSKFGVVPPRLGLRDKTIRPIARVAVRLVPRLRARLQNKSQQLLAERRFDLAFARQCLDESLAALATDYVDFYLVHEPDMRALAGADELRSFLETSVVAGKVRRWGVAYRVPDDHRWAQVFAADVVQFEGGLQVSDAPIDGAGHQRIVTRPFGGGVVADRDCTIFRDPAWRSLSDEVGASPEDLSLCVAQRRAGRFGSVVCSMFSPQHIRRNVRAVTELSADARMSQLVDRCMAQRPTRSTHK